jgi:hypothetical protein
MVQLFPVEGPQHQQASSSPPWIGMRRVGERWLSDHQDRALEAWTGAGVSVLAPAQGQSI